MPVCERRPGEPTCILTGTNAAADELLAHTRLPAERLRVIPYGVDHPYEEPDPEEAWAALQRHNLVDTQFVLWVGSLEPRKGLGTLVAAAATLARRGAAPTLVLAGYAGWRNSKVISPDDRAVLGPRLARTGAPTPTRAERALRQCHSLRLPEPARGLRPPGARGDGGRGAGRGLGHPRRSRGGR